MNLKKKLTAIALTAGLTLGGSAAAFAAEPPPDRPPASAECKAAAQQLAALKRVDAKLRTQFRDLVRLRAVGDRNGNDALVAKLDARIAKLKTARAKLVERVKAEVAEVREECAAPTAS